MTTNGLPRPMDAERYSRLRTGIYDDPSLEVYVNEARDFAYLQPLPTTDYRRYEPRVKRLGLDGYKKESATYARRHEKLAPFLANADSFLEIGAGNAGFLAYLHERHPDLGYACVEPDENTLGDRAAHAWLRSFNAIEAAPAGQFERVGLFHVLEHIMEPESFLQNCAALLSREGRLIIEVPSLDDPLLSVYSLKSYEDFFYQRQHPFYYSAASLMRLLKAAGFVIDALIPHQRYGMENHLNWLIAGKPGGNAAFAQMFSRADKFYRADLEAAGRTDAVIAVVAKAI